MTFFSSATQQASEFKRNLETVVKTAADLATQHPTLLSMMVLYHSAEFVQSCFLVSCRWNISSTESVSNFFVSEEINSTHTPEDVCKGVWSFFGKKLTYSGAVQIFIEPLSCSADGVYQDFCDPTTAPQLN